MATSTLFLVPSSVDRVSVGRRLAAPLVGSSDRDHAMTLRGVHPDIIELVPPEDKERISIAQVRGAIRSAQFAPVEGIRKVCVVYDAERLTTEAANALLKTLEEPPREMAFVLLAGHAGALLPTIVSRSRIVRLAPSANAEQVESLTGLGYSQDEVRWLVSVANRPGELDRFTRSRFDLPELRTSARARASAMTIAELTAAALEGESVLRRAALQTLLERASEKDSDLLTDGVRLLSQQTREAMFVFLHDLVVATFETLRQSELEQDDGHPRTEPERVPPVILRTACLAIDAAHRALTVYAPVEAILLTLFLAVGEPASGRQTGGGVHVS